MASLIRSLRCRKLGPVLSLSKAPISRPFTCSALARVREITETEQTGPSGKVEIVIEGRLKESERRSRLIEIPARSREGCPSKQDCHPLCRLDFVHEIKHTGKNDRDEALYLTLK